MAAPGQAGVVRGTQSFVSVMTQVWRRPSLTAWEIAWRWLAALPGLWSMAPTFTLGFLGMPRPFTLGADHIATSIVFRLLKAVPTHLIPAFIAAFLFWHLVATFGRTLVLRRFDSTLHPRRLSLFLLGTLRSLSLAAAWALWFWLLTYATGTTITAPSARNEDPHLVIFSAMLICGTLFLYVAWGVFSWFLQLSPLLAMREDLGAFAALRAAVGSSKELRGKLIEINLVMNIVRIALLVLAMVFSATPLPFASVESQAFLQWWWVGVGLVYLAFSDYFHVVRAAAYLSLHRALTQN